MTFDPLRHHRRSVRLQGYDYRQPGMYYVTLVTQGRAPVLGSVVGERIQLSKLGEIVREEWLHTPTIRPEVRLDEFVIMPDHLHGIIVICEERNGVAVVGANCYSPRQETPFRSPSGTIGAIVRGFKGASTKRINILRATPGVKFWQRDYYEHIVRDERDYRRIQNYIQQNPLRLALKTE